MKDKVCLLLLLLSISLMQLSARAETPAEYGGITISGGSPDSDSAADSTNGSATRIRSDQIRWPVPGPGALVPPVDALLMIAPDGSLRAVEPDGVHCRVVLMVISASLSKPVFTCTEELPEKIPEARIEWTAPTVHSLLALDTSGRLIKVALDPGTVAVDWAATPPVISAKPGQVSFREVADEFLVAAGSPVQTVFVPTKKRANGTIVKVARNGLLLSLTVGADYQVQPDGSIKFTNQPVLEGDTVSLIYLTTEP